MFQTKDWCLRLISHPENASGFALFQSFPDMVIYVAKLRLKSKGKGFVLIGLCFVGKIGLVKSRVRGVTIPTRHCVLIVLLCWSKSFTSLTPP